MSYASEVSRASKESRQEAEEFVKKRPDLLNTATSDEINAAIGKVAHALWELKIIRLNSELHASNPNRKK